MCTWGFPCSSLGEESACSAGDAGSIPGLGRSPGEENGNPLQCLCLESLMDRGAWWAAVHGVTKSRARLSDQHLHICVLIADPHCYTAETNGGGGKKKTKRKATEPPGKPSDGLFRTCRFGTEKEHF